MYRLKAYVNTGSFCNLDQPILPKKMVHATKPSLENYLKVHTLFSKSLYIGLSTFSMKHLV